MSAHEPPVARTSSVATVTLVVLGALAGCKDRAPAKKAVTPPIDAARAAITVDAAAPEVEDAMPPPVTPPPLGGRGVQVFDLQYGGFAQPGLPAIKDDGSALAVTGVADDGGRGYLDLRFVVLDGSGKVRESIMLVDPDETTDAINRDDAAGNLDVEEALFVTVRERVARANAIVGAGTWRTLVTTERDDSGPPRPSESITAADVTFTYDLARRRLTVARAGAQVAEHDLAKLVPTARARTDEPCPGDLPYLGAVHVDAAARKVLVELAAWPQGHNCGGAGPIFTVIPLP